MTRQLSNLAPHLNLLRKKIRPKGMVCSRSHSRSMGEVCSEDQRQPAWQHQDEMQASLQEAGLPCDMPASIQIAKWVYQQTEKANGQVWVVEKTLQHLSSAWARCLST